MKPLANVVLALFAPAMLLAPLESRGQPLVAAAREFKAEGRYLNIPIKNGAPLRMVSILVDGRIEVKNSMRLADATPDWWAFIDVGVWRGRTITVQVDPLPQDSSALRSMSQSDAIVDAAKLYSEPLRGQFHFSSRRGWNNDPNGLVFYRGEYHLFYQHNPYGCEWGNMHWGHATSRDLLHWEEHAEALSPDDVGPIFSGSAVVDWKNTSGLGQGGHPPLVLIYTAAGPRGGESIASSGDGRTFPKYALNPVIGKFVPGDRDPKVFWHEPTGKWIMVLYGGPRSPGGGRTRDGLPAEQHTLYFFTSPNLRNWTLASTLRGGIGDDRYLYECPDLFELPVDGNPAQMKWVLLAGNSEYAVGRFDGTAFHPEQSRIRGNFGRGFYAPQTFNDAPDGRRIQIGWFKTPTPGMAFDESMTIPQELRLTATADGPRISRAPAKEMEGLRAKVCRLGAVTLRPGSANPLAGIGAELVELRAAFEPGEGSTVIVTVRGARIAYEARTRELVVNDLRAPAPLDGGVERLAIFCDRTGLEIFASGGRVYVPFPFQPNPADLALGVAVSGGEAKFAALDAYELKSIWPPSDHAVRPAGVAVLSPSSGGDRGAE